MKDRKASEIDVLGVLSLGPRPRKEVEEASQTGVLDTLLRVQAIRLIEVAVNGSTKEYTEITEAGRRWLD